MLLLPDGTVIMHGDVPYDPVKAHEYYLRTRKLHPRQKAAEVDKLAGREKKPVTFTIRTAKGNTVKLTAQQLAEQRAYANRRVVQIKKKLSELSVELHKRMAEAKKREADAKKPPTAAEKAKAARDAKQYRDKHQQELANKAKQASAKGGSSSSSTPKSKTETVASLKEEIIRTRDSLKRAVANQRALATAQKNG